ncbi:MAG TPA: CHAT domain-containing protein [Chitinophagaceae bacterium]
MMLILLSACSPAVLSQDNKGTEAQRIYLQVTGTFTRNDSFFVRLKGGTDVGVSKGLSARCFLSYSEFTLGSPRSFTEIGSGEIVSVAEHTSECYAALSLFEGKNIMEQGDIVSLLVKLPARDYRSIFYELSRDNVEFVDVDGRFIYTLKDLLVNDSQKKEEELKASILADFRNAYEKFRNNPKLSKRLLNEIPEGRFRGKIPFDMLKQAMLADLNSFLLYLKTYPDGYRGKDHPISQSFMGWIVSNAPYSHAEVKAALYPIYKNKQALQKKLPVYKTDIIKERACRSFAQQAAVFSDALQFDSAYKMIDFAGTIAAAVNDTFGVASVYLLKAQVDQDREKYADAVKGCDMAIRYATRFVNTRDADRYKESKEVEVRALIKKGYCQDKISLYKDGVKTLALARNRLESYRRIIGETLYYEMLGRIYEYNASVNYNSGNYDRALKYVDTAIAINDALNSMDTKARNAYYYWLKGKICNEQLNSEEALKAFSLSIAIYKVRSEENDIAIVLNDIGHTYYNLAEYRKSILYLDSAKKTLVKYGNLNTAGYSRSLAGNCYWNLGKYDSAIMRHKEAITLRRNSLSGMAYSWKQVGDLYSVSGLRKDVMFAYDSALYFNRRLGDSSGVAEVYNGMGIVYHNDEYYSKAVEYYDRAARLTAEPAASALYNSANAWSYMDTAKARRGFESCELLSGRKKDYEYQFSSIISLGELAYKSSDFKKGNRYYESAAELARQINTPQIEADLLSLKGYSYINKLQLDSSLLFYDHSLKILDTVSKSGYIWGLINKAGVHISKGEFKTADSLYTVAARLAIQTSNQRALGISLSASSFLYSQLGEFDKGIAANDSAMAIFQRTGNFYRLANTYMDRGVLYKSSGDFKRSIQCYRSADSIYLLQKTEENRGNVFNNIGVTYYNQGDYEKAIENFNRSARYLDTSKVTEGFLLNRANLAECYYYLRKPDQARKIMLQVFPQAANTKRIATGMAIVLGQICFDAKKLDSASYYLGLARDYSFASGEKGSMIKSLVWLGKVEAARQNKETAGKLFSEATAITRQYRMVSQGWESFYELGLFYYNQKNNDSAIANFKEAVVIVEINAGNLYGGDEAGKLYKKDPRKFDLYSKLIAALAETGKDEEAWAYANRSNITGMKELAGGIPSGSGNPEKDAAIKQGTQLIKQQNTIDNNIKEILSKPEAEQNKEQLQGYYAEREIVGAKYSKFIEELKKKDDNLYDYFGHNVDPDEFKNYKGNLPPDMAVILYVINEYKLLTFTLTNEKLSINIKELKMDIHNTIRQFSLLLKNRSAGTGTGKLVLRSELDDDDNAIVAKGNYKDYADTLYELLIGRIKPMIETKKKLCIIPNGDLSKFPFQCLGKKMPDSSFRFLVEDFTVFYTNKIDILKDLPAPKEDIASFAVFGVPDKTLRFTQQEALAIGSILKGDKTIYTGNAATERMAKTSLSGKKYVHFATHGILDHAEYSDSYLKFLSDKDTTDGNNGKLTIDEIGELNIEGCDLVTLSACETAVGKELRPGWQISPANSFIKNRVRSVVATLWKVDDEATSILMDEFYRQLTKGTGKADALRLAQQKLSENPKYVHPFFWAPFVLYGDWR